MQKGAVARGRHCLTWMEKIITKLEEKKDLAPSDERKINRFKELPKEHDHEFEQSHIKVLDFIEAEEKATLDSKQTVFDEHVDRVSGITERLEQLENLVGTIAPVMPHASDKDDGRPEVRQNTDTEHLWYTTP